MVSHMGVSTSGDQFQRLEIDGKRYSHIVDPRTGIGLTDHRLVTVIAPDDFTLDGLTKVMSVPLIGPEEEHVEIRLPRRRDAYARDSMQQPGKKFEIYQSHGFSQFYE